MDFHFFPTSQLRLGSIASTPQSHVRGYAQSVSAKSSAVRGVAELLGNARELHNGQAPRQSLVSKIQEGVARARIPAARREKSGRSAAQGS